MIPRQLFAAGWWEPSTGLPERVCHSPIGFWSHVSEFAGSDTRAVVWSQGTLAESWVRTVNRTLIDRSHFNWTSFRGARHRAYYEG